MDAEPSTCPLTMAYVECEASSIRSAITIHDRKQLCDAKTATEHCQNVSNSGRRLGGGGTLGQDFDDLLKVGYVVMSNLDGRVGEGEVAALGMHAGTLPLLG